MPRSCLAFAAALLAVTLPLTGLATRGGRIPPALVASWHASADGGKGLTYTFHADGEYTKIVQILAVNGTCTTRLVAEESGSVTTLGRELRLAPRTGRLAFRDSCAPVLDAEKPIVDLEASVLGFAFVSDPDSEPAVRLRLANASGAASTFRRLDEPRGLSRSFAPR